MKLQAYPWIISGLLILNIGSVLAGIEKFGRSHDTVELNNMNSDLLDYSNLEEAYSAEMNFTEMDELSLSDSECRMARASLMSSQLHLQPGKAELWS